ncbi:glycosyltransferase [Endozoicomonas sp. 2B-B]
MQDIRKKILVVASAGGHLTQAMCSTTKCENIVLVSNKVNIKNTRIRKIYRIWDTQYNPFIHFVNIFFAAFVIFRERPYAVFSTGGPIVLPFALICKFIKLKFIYLDTLSRVVELSNTGKLIKKYHLYSRFFTQWENTASVNNVEYMGKCFDILGLNRLTNKQVKGSSSLPLILVTLGTNDYPFDRLIKLVQDSSYYKDSRVRWLIQYGCTKVITEPENGLVVSTLTREELEQYVKEASLIISHCGIGSIHMFLTYQKHVIFVPRVRKFSEFSDDHQLQIAKEINKGKFKVVFPEDHLPELNFSNLISENTSTKPIDITNIEFSEKIKNLLMA